MLYVNVHTLQNSMIGKTGGQPKDFFHVHFFSLLQFRSPKRKGMLFVLIQFFVFKCINVVCNAEVGANVWGITSNLCHKYE